MTSMLRNTESSNRLSFASDWLSESVWPALRWHLSSCFGIQIGIYNWIKEGDAFPSISDLTATDDITFRCLTADQTARLTDTEFLKFPQDRQKNMQQCVTRGAMIFFAERRDRVIAFASAYAGRAHLFNTTIDLCKRDCYLNYIFVDPEMRGRNIATALRAFRRQWLYEQGFRNLYCFVDTSNLSSLRNLQKIGSETLARIFHIRVGSGFHLMFKIKNYNPKSSSINL